MEVSLYLAQQVAQIAQEVGKFQVEVFRQPLAVIEKSRNDLVTEIDRQSEQRLYQALQALAPDVEFWGEEFGVRGEKNDWQWIVDPIDGTTNFSYGLDVFAISIGLAYKGHPKLGVVFRPYTQDLFIAGEGLGAYMNGKRLQQPSQRKFSESLIATGFPFKSGELYQPFFKASENVLSRARDMRRCGSAALDLSFLASGVFGGFWEIDLNPYDIAGALPLLSELGIRAVDLHGKPYAFGKGRFFLAAHESIFQDFYECVSEPYLQFLA